MKRAARHPNFMFEKIKKYKLVSGLLAASAVFVFAGFLRTVISLERMSGPFILHFNDLNGITAAGGMGTMIFAGLFGIAAVLINGCLAIALEDRSPFFGKLTAVLTLVFAVLLFIAFAAILSVN
jgi:hypothetical protein